MTTIEPDLGTPAPDRFARTPAPATVEVTIDGTTVRVAEGTSVLRAAGLAGTPIPKLCATDSLDAFGSCRLCLVEIDGRPGTPASCTTPCTPGMVVHTETPRLARLRRGVMELYLSDHPHDYLTRPANATSEMARTAAQIGAGAVRYAPGANHLDAEVDASNPYFTFDPATCIVCSRCVRACDDIQGTFALTIEGRGFASAVSPGGTDFLGSECVSCGACVQACPTGALVEDTVLTLGQPRRTVETTCAYCGVGCSFTAELHGDQVVRMRPSKRGGANEGHSCVKGRFAWGYATHKERILTPMVRDSIGEPWREVSWEEAIATTAARLRAVQERHGPGAIGGITSSRCTNEEVFALQKLVRVAFGNNNVDTCARVCHAPTGYGLKTTFGTSAGTQDFRSVAAADVVFVIGANPTDAHPVFASRLKRHLRAGTRLIVADPRRIDLVRSPHVAADHFLQLRPGTNVALINAIAHVVVTEDLVDHRFVAERCEADSFAAWAAFVARPENSPEATAGYTGVDPAEVRAAARLYAGAPSAAIYYGLGVTEHSQGSTMVIGLANLAMATGNIGRDGVGVNPMRGQNNVQGSCDMGSFPHELSGYRHVGDDAVRATFDAAWGTTILAEPGLRIPNMFDGALAGTFRGLFVQGEDIAQSDPNTNHVRAALGALDVLVVQDLFLSETARYAHVFLPGTTFLEKDGTFTNAERRINRVRPVMAPRCGRQEWEVVVELAAALGTPFGWPSAAAIMDEIAALTPTFSGVSFALLDEIGSVQWPCNAEHPTGTPIMHVEQFVRGKGLFVETPYVATDERSTRRFPLLLTTGRTLTQYNVGAQTRRTANVVWYPADVLEIHPADADARGIASGDEVTVSSRVGATVLPALVTDRIGPGVVYTTFHYPLCGANVVTTDRSDWATNCPEYKVTAVEVAPGHSAADLAEAAGRPGAADRVATLARMADEISRQFPHLADEDAAGQVAAHLTKFWEPAMIADLLTAWRSGAASLEPRAAAALDHLAAARPGPA